MKCDLYGNVNRAKLYDSSGHKVPHFLFNYFVTELNNVESNYSNTRINLHPDGSGIFNMMDVKSGYSADQYFLQFKVRYYFKRT